MILVNNNFPKDKLYPFSEVDINGQPAGDEAEAPADYTDPNAMQPMSPTGNDQPAAEEPAPVEGDQEVPQDQDQPVEGGEEPEDFTQEQPPEGGDMGGEDYTGDQPPEGGGGDAGGAPPAGGGGGGGGGGEPVQADDARGIEGEIFKDLTPDQLDTKHKELKSNFTTLYDTTSTLIDRINDIPTSEEYTSTVSFVTEKLSDLRQMITDYMNQTYSTKSYMENVINYNKFLVILKGINDILEEVNSELSKETGK